MIFLFLCWILTIVSATDVCSCNNTGHIHDKAFIDASREITCCVLEGASSDEPIKWFFNNKPLKKSEMFGFECNQQVLTITKVKRDHNGTFSCTLTTSNGTTVSASTTLEVHDNGATDQASSVKVHEETAYAEEGGEATFTCIANVGNIKKEDLSLNWIFYSPEGKGHLIQKDFKREPQLKDGIANGSVVIKSVAKEHFGTYSCSVYNSFGSSISANGTLIEGVHPDEERLRNLKMVLVIVIISIGVVLWMVYCGWRCRKTLAVCYMDKVFKAPTSHEYQYDIFIVHGNKACGWVKEVLLPTLERTYGYLCFVPERDMLAGEQYAESISNAMSKCRCVLVVISPCLLLSQWASLTVHFGISEYLKTTAHILAVVLQELGSDSVSSETTGLLKTLQVIKKITVPRSCNMQESYEENYGKEKLGVESYPYNFNHEVSERNKQALPKLTIPEYLSRDPGSQSPKSQCLSNMITSSNHASQENLDNGKDSLPGEQGNTKGPVVYFEEVGGLEDPGSPSSVTPFILSSCKKPCSRNSQVCDSLCRCMQVVCIGDPEILFWQEVRLCLKPPVVKSSSSNTDTRV